MFTDDLCPYFLGTICASMLRDHLWPFCLGTICAGMFTFLVCLVGFRSMQGPFGVLPVKGKGQWFVREKKMDLTGFPFYFFASFFFPGLFSVFDAWRFLCLLYF